LEKGFMGANMRSIAERAGMTTGAIYRYYVDKNYLFKTIVEPTASEIRNYFSKLAQNQLELLDKNKQSAPFEQSKESLLTVVDFIYSRFEMFDLLLNCSNGSAYESYIDTLIELDLDATQIYIHKLMQINALAATPPAHLIAILVQHSYSQILEIVTRRMSREEAIAYMELLVPFLFGGWSTVWR
jgi:AcrR family transcriptional regulator